MLDQYCSKEEFNDSNHQFIRDKCLTYHCINCGEIYNGKIKREFTDKTNFNKLIVIDDNDNEFLIYKMVSPNVFGLKLQEYEYYSIIERNRYREQIKKYNWSLVK